MWEFFHFLSETTNFFGNPIRHLKFCKFDFIFGISILKKPIEEAFLKAPLWKTINSVIQTYSKSWQRFLKIKKYQIFIWL